MARISWDDPGSRLYAVGLDRGVLYVDGQPGVPWNGLTAITENNSGGAAQPFYVDGEKFVNTSAPEEFNATLTAYTYPIEFEPCDGMTEIRPGFIITKQRRQSFGLSYRSMVGNDQSSEYGYKIHLIYNALASPSARSHKTMNASPNPDDFSWNITTLPPSVTGYKRSSHFIIDSTLVDPEVLSGLEDILYGNDSTSARLPAITEITDLIDTGDAMTVTDNGDGTFTITAPLSAIPMLDSETFQLTWPTGIVIDDADTWTATS